MWRWRGTERAEKKREVLRGLGRNAGGQETVRLLREKTRGIERHEKQFLTDTRMYWP